MFKLLTRLILSYYVAKSSSSGWRQGTRCEIVLRPDGSTHTRCLK